MACYHPIPAYQSGPGEVPRLHPPVGFESMSLPCGSCIGCRTARALQWARRCVHEASEFADNTFVTLTYSEEHVPADGSLVPRALQLFLKRLRRRAGRPAPRGASSLHPVISDRSRSIRFFACGEYGDRYGRPHYHALLFNCGFRDRYLVGKDLYESPTLASLWPSGRAVLGAVTAASANYVAQYSLKKLSTVACDSDGVVRHPVFLRMSLKPGIGANWLSRFRADLQHGYLVADGHRQAIPRAYKARLSILDPQLLELLDFRAHQFRVSLHSDKGLPDRLAAAEVIHERSRALSCSRSL